MIIGKGTYGSEYFIINDWAQGTNLIVGNYCSIARSVTVMLGGNHNMNRVTTYPFGIFHGLGQQPPVDGYSNGDVVIGNDVWIGQNTTILSGITIGDGSVIAACSVVTQNVDPYTVVGGNPTKLIKKRFTDDQISKLLQIKWWDWEFDKIVKYGDLLLNPDIDAFINKALTEL